jgi:hypothetical protein
VQKSAIVTWYFDILNSFWPFWPFRAESIHLQASAVLSRDPRPTQFVSLGEPTSKEQGDLALKFGRQIIDMTTKFKSGKCYIDGKMGGEVFQGMDVDIQEISSV